MAGLRRWAIPPPTLRTLSGRLDTAGVRSRSIVLGFTRKGNTLYVHAHFWPGETLTGSCMSIVVGGGDFRLLSWCKICTVTAMNPYFHVVVTTSNLLKTQGQLAV